MGKLFGTDGVRGIANSELTVKLASDIGAALAAVLEAGQKKAAVLVGRDTRVSGTALECAIAAGLASGGADVVLAGIIPTPAAAYLTSGNNFNAGIMISASHNPAEYNGIKIFGSDGVKLSDSLEDEIENLIRGSVKEAENIGTVRSDTRLCAQYRDYIKNIAGGGSGQKVLFDCANGSAALTAPYIFGTRFRIADFIHKETDGKNINRKCGSTHIEELAQKVRDGGYDMGFAFDGDADRCLAVDELGNTIDGDMIMCALARDMKESGRLYGETLVTTKLSNLGLRKFCGEHDISNIITEVGDRYVQECMLKYGYNLGGEQSGHIIVSDYMTTGDGQLTASLAANLLAKSGLRASELFGAMKVYPQIAENIRVKNEDKTRIMSDSGVLAEVDRIADVLGDNGRIILRPSGTEPMIRIMIEGESLAVISPLSAALSNIINELGSR